MKKLTLSLMILFSIAYSANAQIIPATATEFLNKSLKEWKPAPGFCNEKKWILTGDFDNNGRQDYLVRVKSGKSPKPMMLDLVAFLSFDDGSYQPEGVLGVLYTDEMLRSSFSVLKKGTDVPLRKGEDRSTKLRTDAISQYSCETDANRTLIYEDGEFKDFHHN